MSKPVNLCMILVLWVAMQGCSSPFLLNIKGYKELSESLNQAWKEVAIPANAYIAGSGWQSPAEFEAMKGGACAGFAADLVYHLGENASLVVCSMSFSKKGESHAIVFYQGEYIEPQREGVRYLLGTEDIISIAYVLDYRECMMRTTNLGTKEIGARNIAWDSLPSPEKKQSK